ncbi:MAG TPA: dihydropteroate synthase, partial [Spirochaetota bacterium]|nr:dihydropteroate synthase [Spirochaetota bacterium]
MAVYQSAYKAHILRLDNEFEIRRELANIGVDKKAFDILTQKMSYLHIKVEKVDTRAANLIKQYLSAIGGEAAISQSAYAYTERTTDMIISASRKNIFLLIKKIQEDRYGLSEIAKEIEKSLFSSVGAIKLGNNILDFNKSTYIMGTISLFKSSSLEPASEKSILKKVDGFVKAGANIIDICDECFYKENSEDKDANELLPRVVSIVKQIKERFPGVILSIDTIKINVAKECLDAGIDIINNSIPLKYNEELINLIAKVKCPMIMIFNPTLITDQPKPLISISDVIREIQSNVSYALGKGVDKDKII